MSTTVAPLRFGVRVRQYASSWPALLESGLLAERLGFDGLWVNDHFWTPGRRHGDDAFDGLTTLATLAPLTRRVRLGTAVLSASYRPPALAAKVATAIDVISEGRLVVGLGTGSDRAEHAAYGIPFPGPAERTAGLVETLNVLKSLWSESGAPPPDGSARDAPCRPQTVQRPRPPIWLAGHGPRLLRIAGERADGFVAAFVDPAEFARRWELAASARDRAARPEPLSAALYTYVLPLVSDVDAWIGPEANALGTTPARLRRWLATTGIVAPPDELAGRLAEYHSAGATDTILVLPNRVPDDAIRALGEAVLPVLSAPTTISGDRISADRNLVHRLVGVHRIAGRGADIAVIDDHGEWSFDRLWDATERAQGALIAAGVRRGERVVVALRDGTDWLCAFLGAAALGAVAVPIDPLAPEDRIADILADCEPTAVIASPETAIPTGPWNVLDPRSLADGAPRPPVAVHDGDLAYLVYSSGSTGRPKAAMHAHSDLRAGIETYATEVLALGPDDRCLSVARLFTSLGFGNGFFRPLGRGSAIVLSASVPNVRSVLRTVALQRVTILTGVPTFWAQLADFASRHPIGDGLASVRVAVSSGDGLPAPIAARVRDALGLELVEGLGCSECSNILISTRPGRPTPGRLGTAVSGVDIRLANADGVNVADGEPGRLWIRSSSNTSGYWRRPDLTRDVVHGEWLRMGDVLIREAGTFRHVGRVDDLFKVDGSWVSPIEVESALLEYAGVTEAAVVGRPDDRGLLRPCAFVVVSEGVCVTDRELRQHVAARLDRRSTPTRIEIVSELPRLPSGKVDRRAIRD